MSRFSIALQHKLKAQDFTSYHIQFAFKDASYLTADVARNTLNMPAMLKVMSGMHEEDAHDDGVFAI